MIAQPKWVMIKILAVFEKIIKSPKTKQKKNKIVKLTIKF